MSILWIEDEVLELSDFLPRLDGAGPAGCLPLGAALLVPLPRRVSPSSLRA